MPSDNPRILITGANGESLPPPYGGIIKRCLLHAKEWREKGAEVFIHIHHKHDREADLEAKATYFYDFPRKPDAMLKARFVTENLLRNPRLFLKLFRLERALYGENLTADLYYAARATYLDRKISEIKPDVVVTETGSPQSLHAAEIAKAHGIPCVLENYAEIQYKAGDDGVNMADKYAGTWDRLLNSVDLVVPASEHCAQGPRKYVKDPSKIKTVYSGINFKIFNGKRSTSKEVSREKFTLPKDKFLVMAVGALRMRKGHDQLFESVLLLPKETLAKMGVVLCGMGPVDELRKTAQELGYPNEALHVFQGLSEEDLAELYSCMDCFCFPSITPRECMGMAMKEAMSVGLPISAYNSGGIKEAIEDGVNGFLVPTGDKQALSQAISRMMQLPEEERRAMGQRNMEKAERLFDITRTADQLYQELVRLATRKS